MEHREKLQVDDLKRIEVEILTHIDRVLKKNNIPFWLDGGTLLGAVRHKGIIPWDDDIDIIVRRKDFKKVLEVLREEGERYRVLSRYDDPEYYYLFAKVVDSHTSLTELEEIPINGLGVWVDIFPLDNLPTNDRERAKFQKRVALYRNIAGHSLRYIKGDMLTIKDKVFCYLSNLYGWKRAYRRIDAICQKTSNTSTKYVADIIAATNERLEVPAAAFAETIELEFENNMYPAPVGYDCYLKNLYGDYMKLPPVEKRMSHHVFEAYRIK